MRPVRALLALGLVLLVGAHLVGALHGPGFTGAHPRTALPAVCGGQAADPTEPAPGDERGPGPQRDHADGHDVPHAVDRLRGPAGAPVSSPDNAVALPFAPTAPAAPADRPDRPRGAPSRTAGRASLALHCVWRQ
ncbi:hypothetical protein [Streptomyces pathocidini]|uniref:hypothetical protein n=1 Tax=Streptomyces pathocidini TaxID=1650571 RepID=UPI000B0087AC|nr:hypothetical protein [Streptomyces pathocidini]